VARPKEVPVRAPARERAGEGSEISVSLRIPGILAILAGILILIFPKLLNYIVAGYLIFVGVVQIFNIRF
jgi:Protein of unknown function (DUF3096)